MQIREEHLRRHRRIGGDDRSRLIIARGLESGGATGVVGERPSELERALLVEAHSQPIARALRIVGEGRIGESTTSGGKVVRNVVLEVGGYEQAVPRLCDDGDNVARRHVLRLAGHLSLICARRGSTLF